MSGPKKDKDDDICPASKFAREQQSHFVTAENRGVLAALVKEGEQQLKANGCKPLKPSRQGRTPTAILGDRG